MAAWAYPLPVALVGSGGPRVVPPCPAIGPNVLLRHRCNDRKCPIVTHLRSSWNSTECWYVDSNTQSTTHPPHSSFKRSQKQHTRDWMAWPRLSPAQALPWQRRVAACPAPRAVFPPMTSPQAAPASLLSGSIPLFSPMGYGQSFHYNQTNHIIFHFMQ
jgi:hypothetical protein